ncbi:MAG: exo-alpha-sialidase [Planctomycetota bacterium]|nr:exo-alpha-sialidase [Planctomycetota bacterium]MDA1214338.1 exo-alpha-sialidase [Planctomycetota bacterium]
MTNSLTQTLIRPARFFVTLMTAIVLFTPPAQTTEKSPESKPYPLAAAVREKCLMVIREGLHSDEFWPSIHAAEALTITGNGNEVRELLEPMLETETDDQKRCGLAREIARTGDRGRDRVMFRILENTESNGRIHAAESLYKLKSIGDGEAMRQAFAEGKEEALRLMAAAALGQSGNSNALIYLRSKLHDENPEVSMVAAWVIGRLGDVRDAKELRAAAENVKMPLARAFFEYALAQLRDEQGQQTLLKNLTNEDDAVRTYAADVAGSARLFKAVPELIRLLDDDAVDCRIRAAQSLIMLSQPSLPPPHEDISVIVYEASQANPRYTEGSVIELNNGDLLNAVTEFSETTSDFAHARIIGKTSSDGGRSWSETQELQRDIGKLNVLGTTLRWLPGETESKRTLGMIYNITQGYDSIQVFLKTSTDDGVSFGEPVLVSNFPGYNIVVSDRMTILKSGRILLPCSYTTDIIKVNHMVCFCYYSDDRGKTWQKGSGEVDLPKRGAMEPDVVELRDGRILMIMRNQLGTISTSYSRDAGETWSDPGTLADLQAPESPATLRTIPSTGDLLLVWNETYDPHADHGGARTPLTAAISTDDGSTWEHKRQLESDATRTYAYTSLTFIGDRAVLSYWDEDRKTGRYSSRFRSLPVSWFYEDEHSSN